MLEKVADYLKGGIPHIWIPDLYRFTPQEADSEVYGMLDRLAR